MLSRHHPHCFHLFVVKCYQIIFRSQHNTKTTLDMDAYSENLRLAESGVQQTLKTLQTVLAAELTEKEQGDLVDSLKQVMENYIGDIARLKHNHHLLQEFKRTLNNVEVSEWPEDMQGEFQKLQQQNEGKLKIDVKSHQWMRDFDKLVADSNNKGETDGDEDMVVSSQVTTICPVTRKEMVRPVRNVECGHVYDREGIEALMKQSAGTRCPVVGCRVQAVIKPSSLREDKETKRAINNKRK